MKAIRRFLFARAGILAFTALALSTALAAAQSSLHGTFDLPMEAHWEKAVLPAGEYSYSVEILTATPLVTVRSADGKWAAMFLSRSLSQTPECNSQDLTLTSRDGEMFVSSFRLGEMGIALNYAVPKEAKTASGARRPAQPAVLAASNP
jgi:hypothetical protein